MPLKILYDWMICKHACKVKALKQTSLNKYVASRSQTRINTIYLVVNWPNLTTCLIQYQCLDAGYATGSLKILIAEQLKCHM